MTRSSAVAVQPALGLWPVWRRLAHGSALPVATVVALILLLWYAAAIWLNGPQVRDQLARTGQPYTASQFIQATWSMERPVLPTPGQIGAEFKKTVFDIAPTSKRSLVYHAYVTTSAAVLGFAFGTLLGILLAAGIVHVRTLDRSLLPWIIASQTIPILAIAPMIIVVLGSLGMTGLMPKAIISMYLCFFPITIGMVKGLRSPDPLQLDLMRTYSARGAQVFWKLRWPAAVPFLFPSLKIGISLALVGAIVGELPTGAQAGIGARLLTGSYFGQMIQLWSALVMAAVLALLCVFAVTLAERAVIASRGGKG